VFTATDNVPATPISATLAWNGTVANAPIYIAGPFPNGPAATAYNQSVAVTGAFVSPLHAVTLTAGAVPPGLALSISGTNVVLSGTPTATGSFNFSITVSDSATPNSITSAAQNESLVIGTAAMTLTGTLPSTAPVGQAYSGTLWIGGTPVAPVVVSAASGAIPSWMTTSVSGNAVTFSGVPASGTYSFTPKVTDSSTPTPQVATGSAQSIGAYGNSISWSQRTVPYSTFVVAYGSGTIVLLDNATYGFAYSTNDGTSWTTGTLPTLTTVAWDDVTYGNGVFVGAAVKGTDSNALVTSPDGVTWTARAVPTVTNSSGWYVYFANGLFFLFMQFDSGSVYRGNCFKSTDGVTWTAVTMPGGFSGGAQVVYGNGVYLAMGIGSATVAKSTDGTTWSVAQSAIQFNSIAFGASVFVGVDASGNVHTSSDGVTWTARSTPISNDALTVTFCNGLFCAFLVSTSYYLTSADGITWLQNAYASSFKYQLGYQPVPVNATTIFAAAGTPFVWNLEVGVV
jgi:hypothetical protein